MEKFMFGWVKKSALVTAASVAFLWLAFPAANLARAQDGDIGNLGIPSGGSIQSGVGIVSGWKCTSNGLT
ncbi:MAG: hypothetical protein P8K76_16515, partial [Candidatus Binatia bacterium]|nr:hypothetical protein [Candidatus Binatia bacterium]MDG2011365.1 hypothetical protein [Candidatus Binatia bacterium]